MPKTNNLPYFNTNSNYKQKIKEKEMARFLFRKFKPTLRKTLPEHYLIQPLPHKSLGFIKKTSKTYRYFLQFDIRLYHPSIDHQILLEIIPKTYKQLTGNPVSRRFKKHLKKEIPNFLSRSPYKKGISTGSPLSYTLSSVFLLPLDINIKNPFLRKADDYLVFCKNKKEPEELLTKIVCPKLQELGLEINEKKLKSGKFHRETPSFIGFNFHSGNFFIKKEKIEELRKRITTLTHLTPTKSPSITIKQVNNKIRGFAHYYKFANCKKTFTELDSFTRMRVRRRLLKQKTVTTESNFLMSNEELKKLVLKSFREIKESFDASPAGRKFITQKKISKKPEKKSVKSGKETNHKEWLNLEERACYYRQKLILDELRELTSLIKKLEKKL